MKSVVSFLKRFFELSAASKDLEDLVGWQKADAVFQSLVSEAKVPGMAVTISKEGVPVLEKGYGYTNLEAKSPVSTTDTIFRTASVSKCITGMALAKMMEEKLVDLDASFYDYVSYYPKKQFDFTLRHLASHTAGIRSYRGKEFALNRPYSIKDSLEIFQNDPLLFESGKGYSYNSFDFVLLSLAMQEAAGIPFEDYVKEKVLSPLEMKMTFAPNQVGCHPGLVEGFNLDNNFKHVTEYYTKTASSFKKAVEVDNFYKLAGGGYLSTSSDIAKLGAEILNPKVIDPKILAEVLTLQMVNGESTYYGLGFQVSKDAQGRNFVGHVGSSVGAYSNFFVYPDARLVISILINSTDSKVQPSLDEAVAALF